MGILQIGSNFKPASGYTLFFDASIPESYGGSGTTWTNLSNNGNNCSLVNGPQFVRLPTGAGSFTFNGSNQYGQVSVVNLNGSFTMTTWVNKSDTSSTGWIYGGGWIATQESRGLGVALGIDGSRLYLTAWAIWDGTANASNITSSYNLIQANKWYNVAVVQDGGSRFARLYLDGVEVGSGGYYNALYYTTGGSSVNFIGQRSHPGGGHWGGSIGQVLVYNGVMLSQQQLVDHFNQTRARYGR